jgi:hypothetical protein
LELTVEQRVTHIDDTIRDELNINVGLNDDLHIRPRLKQVNELHEQVKVGQMICRNNRESIVYGYSSNPSIIYINVEHSSMTFIDI